MGWFFKGEQQAQTDTGNYEVLSTPFLQVGDGNLSLPYVNKYAQGAGGSIMFGADNLFPQLLNQMYYTSPLNAAIIDFKTNATIGGGYTIEGKGGKAIDKINIYAFEKRIKLKKLQKKITRELIAHERVYMIIKHKKTVNADQTIATLKPIKAEFISSDKVRKKQNGKYALSNDWSTYQNGREIAPMHPNCHDVEQLYVFENDSLGQDYYPIPAYSTCLNWCFLDGEAAMFHKTNIKESIFPSFALFFPKKPANKEEKEEIRDTVNRNKGAQNAGRIMTFFANRADQLPKLEAIPTNQNDKLFLQSDERTDTKICQAHVIDPILMGIRVSGKLGNGSDIKQSYTILEKNQIMPRREEVEEIFNDIIDMFGIDATYKVNDYQIIGDIITKVEEPEKKTAQ